MTGVMMIVLFTTAITRALNVTSRVHTSRG